MVRTIVVISLIAALITIFVFLSGKQNVKEVMQDLGPTTSQKSNLDTKARISPKQNDQEKLSPSPKSILDTTVYKSPGENDPKRLSSIAPKKEEFSGGNRVSSIEVEWLVWDSVCFISDKKSLLRQCEIFCWSPDEPAVGLDI